VFEAGSGGSGAKDPAQFVQADFLRDVKLDQNENGPLQGSVRLLYRDSFELYGVFGDSFDHRFAFHDIHSAPRGKDGKQDQGQL
jgi:hypothetical protein